MAEVELPTLTVDSVAAIVAATGPLLLNRDPAPDEVEVALTSPIAMELVDPGVSGVDRGGTRVWIGGAPAFDGAAAPQIADAFAGARSGVVETADTLRITLDPIAPFLSEAIVVVRVASRTKDAAGAIDETYSFRAEDRTAPRLLAGAAVAPRALRLGFDEPVVVTDPSAITLTPRAVPAVPVTVVDAVAAGMVVELTLSTEATPDVAYRVKAGG